MTTTEHRADNVTHLQSIADKVPNALEGWKATTGTQANGLPIIEITSPDGATYRAGLRWGNRDESRVTVWPADVDHDALPYAPQSGSRASVPEATFAAGRGITGLRQALRRVSRDWEPLRAQMLAKQAERQAYEDRAQKTRERLRKTMGPTARNTDEGASLYLDGTSIDARAYDDSIRLEYMSLPTEVALKVIKLIREEVGE